MPLFLPASVSLRWLSTSGSICPQQGSAERLESTLMSSASLELRSRSTVLELRRGHGSVKGSSLEVWQPSLVSTSLVAERERGVSYGKKSEVFGLGEGSNPDRRRGCRRRGDRVPN